jgi:hypothetical protein
MTPSRTIKPVFIAARVRVKDSTQKTGSNAIKRHRRHAVAQENTEMRS